jgi:myo-inositol 2-dehydrogenase / D-chiro-inositol 1-dehydrogenase
VRVGFVGAGAIAGRHLDALRVHPDVVVAAVCDADEARARAVAGPLGARAFGAWEAMLEGEPLDAVFVCTPPAAHAPPAVAALGRGIPAYVEKPLARGLEDGRAIVAAWRAAGVPCAAGYQWRSLDLLDTVRKLLDGAPPGVLISRGIGPTERGRADLGVGGAPARPWFADRAQSGGILFELASHDVDLQVALAGPVAAVQADAGRGLLAAAGVPGAGAEDAVAALLRFAGGGLGVVAVAWTEAPAPPAYTVDVLAGDVALRLALDPAFRLTGQAGPRPVDVRSATAPRQAAVDRFLAAVRAGDQGPIACSPADALHTLAATLACETAIATGQPAAVEM